MPSRPIRAARLFHNERTRSHASGAQSVIYRTANRKHKRFSQYQRLATGPRGTPSKAPGTVLLGSGSPPAAADGSHRVRRAFLRVFSTPSYVHTNHEHKLAPSGAYILRFRTDITVYGDANACFGAYWQTNNCLGARKLQGYSSSDSTTMLKTPLFARRGRG